MSEPSESTSRVRAWGQRIRRLGAQPMFREGVRDCAPMSIGIVAWGLVAGVAMAKSGMGAPLAIVMAVLVYAGSAQIAVIPLIAADAPMWVVWGTAACVSLRFLVYSYYYRPYFLHLPRRRRLLLSYFMGDTTFAMFIRRFPQPDAAAGQQAYFAGAALVTYSSWQVSIIIGIVAGQVVPQAWGLGFAGSMALLALSCTQMRSLSACFAALVACCAAVATYRLPLHLNIVVAIAAAIAVGALARRMRPSAVERGGVR